MKKIYFFLVAIFATTMYFGQSPGDIIITEIMQNPSAVSDANGEYFEVYNTTAGIIDMNGWVIKDNGTNSHTIANGGPLNIDSGAYLVFWKNSTIAENVGVILDYASSSISLTNGDDEVILETGGGLEIDRVDYDGGPNFPDPSGKSMELSTMAYTSSANDIGANWAEGSSAYGDGDLGTPGAVNDNSVPLGIADHKIEGFKIFPNPSNGDFINITTTNNTPKNVQVFDMLGKRVINQEVNTILNISNLTTGIYVVKVTENSISATKRLVVK